MKSFSIANDFNEMAFNKIALVFIITSLIITLHQNGLSTTNFMPFAVSQLSTIEINLAHENFRDWFLCYEQPLF